MRRFFVCRNARLQSCAIILEAAQQTAWSERFLATLGSWDGEIERRPQTPVTELKNPFD